MENLVSLIAANQGSIDEVKKQLSKLQYQQDTLLQSLLHEKSDLDKASAFYNLPHLFETLTLYTQKANKLRLDMKHLSERSAHLKVRVDELMARKRQQDEVKLEEMVRQEQRERLLVARPAWEANS